MAISLPAGSGSARNLASRSRQKAEFVSIAPFAIHQEVRLRPVHDTGARRLSKHITTRVAPSAGGTWHPTTVKTRLTQIDSEVLVTGSPKTIVSSIWMELLDPAELHALLSSCNVEALAQ